MSSTACSIAFCKVASVTEPVIICYGPCQLKFHAICLGIPEVCIDKFRDPTSGYKYVCINCRDISIASISKEFKRMEMGFKALRTKFLSFEKSSSAGNNVIDIDDSSPLGLSVKRCAKEMGELTVPVAKKISTRSSRVKDVASKAKNVIVDLTSPPSGPSSATSSSNNAAPSQSLASVPSTPSSAVTPTNDVVLTAVPKPMSVFVSRLNPQTTVQQVTSYICLKLGYSNAIKVKKLTNNRKAVSSFKIDVTGDLVNSLLQKDFWPDGTFVNSFEDRSNNRVGRLNNRIRFNQKDNTNQRIRKTIAPSNASNSKN